MTPPPAYDVLIAGGGLIGASLAVALAPTGLRVGVVELHVPESAAQPSYDDRSTAVAEGSRRILAAIGAWSRLGAAATAIRSIHVSDRGRFGVTRLDAAEHGVLALGYVVENRALGAALWHALGQAPNARIEAPARAVDARCDASGATVSVESSDGSRREVSARLLVVADGARSALRERLGVGAEHRDYGQVAVVANVTPRRFHHHVAYERFTDGGPLAFLPLGGGRCAVVWTIWAEEAPEVLGLDDGAFLARLQSLFGHRLGTLLQAGARAAYPLELVTATQQTGPRFAIAGNAAHALHPVGGQGFNLALRDIAVLAELIADAHAAGADFGAPDCLARYAEWRAGDQARSVEMTDGLVRLFTNPLAPVRAARGAGLLALDLLPFAKAALARQSMGLAGRVPRLARGLPLCATTTT
jgi:2-octaprenyl-6-methoxyphenol hydroxylase